MEKTKVKIIYGPTSSGKTTFAVESCKKDGGAIISSDSRQVYKYMDIGTGKVPLNKNNLYIKKEDHYEIDGVKVYGYDLATPDDMFSGYDFAKYALKKSKELIKQNVPVYLVGGTGFYIDLFTGRVKPSNIVPDEDLRSSLNKENLKELQDTLRNLSPVEFEKIDQKNPVRIIRAIEKLKNKKSTTNLDYLENVEFEYIYFDIDRTALYERADNWCINIWKETFFEEVKNLLTNYPESIKLNGLIYKSAVLYVKNELTFEESLQRAKYDVHAYIRRQGTYFRKMIK